MRVFVAGATGVIGRRLLPLLTDSGHTPIAMVRNAAYAPAGYEFVVADALVGDAVKSAVAEAKPDAIVDMLTAIPPKVDPKRLASDFALTNRLRTVGTRSLVEACREVGVGRFITQGLAYGYRPGDDLADEDVPLWADGPTQFQPVVKALLEHEQLTRRAGGLVLRFGHIYGPGTIYASDGSFTKDVAAGKIPLVGGGNSMFSFTHTRDAAAAIVAALPESVTGVLNIVDDKPVPMYVWLPEVAAMLGAAKPKAAPVWLARFVVGSWGVAFMNELRGAHNARARSLLDWRPEFDSWRDGFAAELGTYQQR